MKRVFSGVQPTGTIHIGNYLGALKQFPELQGDNECIYCIVDEHAITLPKDPKTLKENILDMAALYIAIGINPSKSIIFVQSDVPAHAELSWILNGFTYMGELSKMTQYKDKSKKVGETIPTALFSYPVLMAADILLYDTDIVPVGTDQIQHIELTRDIAKRFNNRFKEDVFVIPEGKLMENGSKIMALDEPEFKMSKSSESEMSYISLLDDEKTIEKKIKRATTDSIGEVNFDSSNQAGIANLLTIYSAFSGKKISDIVKEYEGKGYGDFKNGLIGCIIESIIPIQNKYFEIRQSSELKKILADGADRANNLAQKKLKQVKKIVGLGV